MEETFADARSVHPRSKPASSGRGGARDRSLHSPGEGCCSPTAAAATTSLVEVVADASRPWWATASWAALASGRGADPASAAALSTGCGAASTATFGGATCSASPSLGCQASRGEGSTKATFVSTPTPTFGGIVERQPRDARANGFGDRSKTQEELVALESTPDSPGIGAQPAFQELFTDVLCHRVRQDVREELRAFRVDWLSSAVAASRTSLASSEQREPGEQHEQFNSVRKVRERSRGSQGSAATKAGRDNTSEVTRRSAGPNQNEFEFERESRDQPDLMETWGHRRLYLATDALIRKPMAHEKLLPELEAEQRRAQERKPSRPPRPAVGSPTSRSGRKVSFVSVRSARSGASVVPTTSLTSQEPRADSQKGSSYAKPESPDSRSARRAMCPPIVTDDASLSDGKADTSRSPVVQSLWLDPGGTHRRLPMCRCALGSNIQAGAACLVRSHAFDPVVCVLLTLNMLSVGLQTDHMARAASTGKELQTLTVHQAVELVFCGVFVTELIIRTLAHGKHLFLLHDWRWTVFDIAVVSLQLTEAILILVPSASSIEDPTNLTVPWALRSVRLVRGLRFVRLFKMVHELRNMACSIITSMRSFFWTATLLLMMVYIVAVYFTQVVADFARSHPAEYSTGTDLLWYWGSLGSSVLSLFQAMTGGVGWEDVVRPLRRAHGWSLTVVFALYVAFATLVVLNLVTGIFVDSAQESVKLGRDLDLVNRVRELFGHSDSDRSGVISWVDFEKQLANPRMADYFKAIDLHHTEARLLFNLLDVHGAGEINLEDFVNGCLRLRGTVRALDHAMLVHSWRSAHRWSLEHLGRVETQVAMIAERVGVSAGTGRGWEPNSGAQTPATPTTPSTPVTLAATAAARSRCEVR